MNQKEPDDDLVILRLTLADYSRLTGSWPAIDLVAVKTTTRKPAADETLFDEIRAALVAPGTTGWVRFRSGLEWTGSAPLDGFADQGPPVTAEWTLDDQTSCRLRLDPDKPGRAVIWNYRERLLSEKDKLVAGEFPFLREKAALLAHHARLENRKLTYHVFWGSEDESEPHALSRRFDRFAGFVETET